MALRYTEKPVPPSTAVMAYYPGIKRGLDIVISVCALGLLLPIGIALAICICLESKGSPFFLQTRVGLEGKSFRLIKFRSMVPNAASLGSHWTTENDPRITRVGRFLRITSLDELPQLWNVLIGDMSLIGPRPALPIQQAEYGDAWTTRHRVRPGISGRAQTNKRSAMEFSEQVQEDLAYVSQPTFHQDMHIALKTLRMALARQGTN